MCSINLIVFVSFRSFDRSSFGAHVLFFSTTIVKFLTFFPSLSLLQLFQVQGTNSWRFDLRVLEVEPDPQVSIWLS
jgi:hypothetical protein